MSETDDRVAAQDGPFDRDLRRRRRDRAARSGSEAFYLHRRAVDELVERLDMVRREFTSVLDLGCGPGQLSEALADRGMDIVSADPGFLFARAMDGVQCDEDRLPFADAAFDLVISVGMLDSVNDLPGALALVRRLLRPDGLFLAAFAGAGSLPRLRAAMQSADEASGRGAAAHVHPQIDARMAGDLLSRAGFALPVADREAVTVRFAGFDRLVADLRAMGATNLLRQRSRLPVGRAGLAAARADFAGDAGPDGRTAETFEIIYLSGWAPSPDQPRPARRGSAAVSLADAIGRKA